MPFVARRYCRPRNEHRHLTLVGRGAGSPARGRWISWQACLLIWPVSVPCSPLWRSRSLFSLRHRMSRRKPKLSHKMQERCWHGQARRTSRRSKHAQSKTPAILTSLPKNMRLRLARPLVHRRRRYPEIPSANTLRPRRKRGGSSKKIAPAAGPTSRTQALRAGFSVTPIEFWRNLQA
jgi:hypothetical protein